MTTTRTTDFNMGDGDEYFNENIEHFGYILLWRPAPYHWVAMHIENRAILSYCEGDISEYTYDTEKAFLEGLQETKDWWVKQEGKSANPVLAGCAEPYGFLTGDPINLNPPKCPVCGRHMYPNSNGGRYSCLNDCIDKLEDLGDKLKAENASEEEYNRRILGS